MTMTNPCIPLDHANQMTDIGFVEVFGDVAENAPWVAEYALGIRPFLNRNAMITAFCDGLFQAREDAQLDLIRAHPDHPVHASSTETVPDAMLSETYKSSVDHFDEADLQRFNDFNLLYRQTFGFPFILAVEDTGEDGILKHLEERLSNSRNEEFKTALAQIAEIFRIRIEDRICSDRHNFVATCQSHGPIPNPPVLDLEGSS